MANTKNKPVINPVEVRRQIAKNGNVKSEFIRGDVVQGQPPLPLAREETDRTNED